MPNRIAIFDPDAFYPFRSLVEGQIKDWSEIESIERFIRAAVLHDEMSMEIEPFGDDEIEYEDVEPGPRNVIVGFGPDLKNYEGLLSTREGPYPNSSLQLSPNLLVLASRLSNAGPGNPYYNAHVEYMQRLGEVWQSGGSVVCDGDVAKEAQLVGMSFPVRLFETIDTDWTTYARAAEIGKIGPVLPPILSIVLTRCERREHIPMVLRELRDEWADARNQVWELVDKLKASQNLREANEIERQLDEASKYFSPAREGTHMPPLRAIWDVFTTAGGSSIDSAVAGGDPMVGALSAGVREALSITAKSGLAFGRLLFGFGALDLARKVRRETVQVEPMTRLLSRILTPTEKVRLGV